MSSSHRAQVLAHRSKVTFASRPSTAGKTPRKWRGVSKLCNDLVCCRVRCPQHTNPLPSSADPLRQRTLQLVDPTESRRVREVFRGPSGVPERKQNLPQLYRFCFLMLGDSRKAQDVFHATLREAAQRAARGELPTESFWLFPMRAGAAWKQPRVTCNRSRSKWMSTKSLRRLHHRSDDLIPCTLRFGFRPPRIRSGAHWHFSIWTNSITAKSSISPS